MKAVVLLLFATNVLASSNTPLIQIVFNVEKKDGTESPQMILNADDILSLDGNDTVIIEDVNKVKLDPEKVFKMLFNLTDEEKSDQTTQSMSLLDFIRELVGVDIEKYTVRPKDDPNLIQIMQRGGEIITPEKYKEIRTLLDEEIEPESKESNEVGLGISPRRRTEIGKDNKVNFLKGLISKISIHKSESSADETENSNESFKVSSRNGKLDGQVLEALEKLLKNMKSKGDYTRRSSPSQRGSGKHGSITINTESTKMTSSENKKDSLNVNLDPNELSSDLVKLIEKVMDSNKDLGAKPKTRGLEESPDYRRSMQEPDSQELRISLSYNKKEDDLGDTDDLVEKNYIAKEPVSKPENFEVTETPIISNEVMKVEPRFLIPKSTESETKEDGNLSKEYISKHSKEFNSKQNLKQYLKQLIGKIRKELKEDMEILKSKLATVEGREELKYYSEIFRNFIEVIKRKFLQKSNDDTEISPSPQNPKKLTRREGNIEEPINKGKKIVERNNFKNNHNLQTANEEFNSFVANELPVLYVNTISNILAKENLKPKNEKSPPNESHEKEVEDLIVEDLSDSLGSDDLESDDEFLKRLKLAKTLKKKSNNIGSRL